MRYQDLPLALRRFRKSPGFTLIAIGTIALAVGANTAIFSVVHSVLMSPIPYREPDRLVSLSEKRLSMPGLDRLSYRAARDLADRSGVIEGIVFYRDGAGGRLIENGEAEVLRGQRVSADFFQVLGIRAEIGRTFLPGDSVSGGNDVILLSHTLWQTRFGGDLAIVGRPLEIVGRPIRVIGVLPADFHPMHMSNPGEIPQVFGPLDIQELEFPGASATAIARLKPGIAIGPARAALNQALRSLQRERPAEYPRDSALFVQPLREKLTGNVGLILWMLLAAAACVLLIACANIANLLLTRASARDSEMAVRAALGSGPWRLVRQVLAESALVAAAGGVFGVLLAGAAIRVLASFAPTEIPRADEIRIDLSVLLFAFLVSLLAAALCGAAPAFRATRLRLLETLQGSRDTSGGRSARGLRGALVTAEIAAAFVLAIGAGLLGRSVDRLLHVPAGYDPRHLLTMTAFAYDDTTEKALRHYRRIVERIRAIPGVEDAAMVSTLPLSSPQQSRIYMEERPPSDDAEAPVMDTYFATPGYLRVMRIPLVRGRGFTERDGPGAPPVAILSESAARLQFPREDPIGKRIGLGVRGQWATVVGVVGDVRQHGMDEGPSAGVYCPQAQHADFYYRLVVRTPGDPWRVYPGVRAALREIDPYQPMFHVQPMDDYVTKSLADRIFALSLIGLLALLAVALAAVGIYGVVSCSVALRTRELGVRMALGAGRAALLGLVVRDLLTTLGVGLGIGLVAALALTRFLSHLLYGVLPGDPATLSLTAVGLAIVALAAAVLPCARAMRIDPAAALRYL